MNSFLKTKMSYYIYAILMRILVWSHSQQEYSMHPLVVRRLSFSVRIYCILSNLNNMNIADAFPPISKFWSHVFLIICSVTSSSFRFWGSLQHQTKYSGKVICCKYQGMTMKQLSPAFLSLWTCRHVAWLISHRKVPFLSTMHNSKWWERKKY